MPQSSIYRDEPATLRFVATHFDAEAGGRAVYDIVEPKLKFRGQTFRRLQKVAARDGLEEVRIIVEGRREDGTWYVSRTVAV